MSVGLQYCYDKEKHFLLSLLVPINKCIHNKVGRSSDARFNDILLYR